MLCSLCGLHRVLVRTEDDAARRNAAPKRPGRVMSAKVSSRNSALNIAGGVKVDVFVRCRCVPRPSGSCFSGELCSNFG